MSALKISHTVLLRGLEEMPVDLYFAAATVRDRLPQSMPEANTALNLLEDYVNGAIVERARFREGHRIGLRLLAQLNSTAFDQAASDELFLNLHVRFLDLHFYAVCLDKVEKLSRVLLRHLTPLAEMGGNRCAIRDARVRAEKRLQSAVSPITGARNYLEHLDNEIARGNFDGLQLQSEGTASQFTFGQGEQRTAVEFGGLDTLIAAYEALVDYIRSLPIVQ